MRNLLIIIAAAMLLSSRIKSDISGATANQVQGCYIFTDSKPTAKYEYLGTVTLTPKERRKELTTSQYHDIRDALLKALKAKYPQANGAIFNLRDGDTDTVDAIKLIE